MGYNLIYFLKDARYEDLKIKTGKMLCSTSYFLHNLIATNRAHVS